MRLQLILDTFGTKLKEDTQKAIDEAIKQRASKNGGDFAGNSRLSASVRFYYSTRSNNPVFNLAMSDYWEVLNDGRGKGKTMPPTDSILKWIKKRGIKAELSDSKKKIIKLTTNKIERKDIKTKSIQSAQRSLAFAIAVNIGKKGIDPTHFFDKVVNDGRLVELQKTISETMRKDIVIQFKKDGE